MFYRSPTLFVLVVGIVGFLGGPLRADTVYLKNGNWIDGIVQPKSDNTILLVIGNVGQVEISLEDVYEIEKNSLTGSEIHVPVDSRKLTVKVDPKGSDAKGGDADDKEGGEEDFHDEAIEEVERTRLEERRREEIRKEIEAMDSELKKRIETLVEDLQRQKSRFRVRAERHLKRVGPAAVPFLLPLADDESDLVRISVYRLFHTYGDERVVDPSIAALLDTNEYVRDYAHRTLQRVTQEDFGYTPLASPRRREYAQAKWVKWWEEEQAALEELEDQARENDANPDAPRY